MGPGLYEAWGVERFTLRRMVVYLRLNRTSGDCLSPERTGKALLRHLEKPSSLKNKVKKGSYSGKQNLPAKNFSHSFCP